MKAKTVAELEAQREVTGMDVLRTLKHYVDTKRTPLGYVIAAMIHTGVVKFSKRQEMRVINLAKKGVYEQAMIGNFEEIDAYAKIIEAFETLISNSKGD